MSELNVQGAKSRMRQVEKIIEKYGSTPDLERVLEQSRTEVGLAALRAFDRSAERRRRKLSRDLGITPPCEAEPAQPELPEGDTAFGDAG